MSTRYEFKNRWLVEGTLTTLGPMHIGTGDWIEPEGGWDVPKDNWLRTDKPSEKEPKFAKVSGLMRDDWGRPYIPGSTLKGCVRSWLESKLTDRNEAVRRSFGYQVQGTKEGVGGRWEFMDARMPEGKTVKPRIAAQTAIDRVTRTADDRKLFHCEVTPAGTEFAVRIAGQNLEDEDMAVLLAALDEFKDEGGAITVGGGGADGWGRMKWVRTGLRKLRRERACQGFCVNGRRFSSSSSLVDLTDLSGG